MEEKTVHQILIDLIPNFSNSYILVGGLALKYYISNTEFHDIDFAAKEESILQTSITNKFNILHHHSNPPNFYFQLSYKNSPENRIEIFADLVNLNTQKAKIFSLDLEIPIIEELYLFTLRDILIVINHPRGIPPKYIKKLEILRKLVDRKKIEEIWEKRHSDLPVQDSKIYTFETLKKAETFINNSLKKNKENIREWTKSDPYLPCKECVKDQNFPLLRDLSSI